MLVERKENALGESREREKETGLRQLFRDLGNLREEKSKTLCNSLKNEKFKNFILNMRGVLDDKDEKRSVGK